ncbi:hypothetical protein [Porphyrobacter sp. HT-58-2]|uniref:hypothetical protein n=1 Tax=Porphyrobacter sp. HT-58-2 TaxID=2023229 RepID=UPI0011B01512|nr:hypothetical protein [Porphyrobacter sp. HT-58-2]
MIRASSHTGHLVQRLRVRAARLVNERVDALHRRQHRTRTDWHSAAALWPDLFGDQRDGK